MILGQSLCLLKPSEEEPVLREVIFTSQAHLSLVNLERHIAIFALKTNKLKASEVTEPGQSHRDISGRTGI